MPDPIRFLDMKERNDLERKRIVARIYELEAFLRDAGIPDPGSTSDQFSEGDGAHELGRTAVFREYTEEQRELLELRAKVNDAVVDPIFLAVAHAIDPALTHVDGLLPTQQPKALNPDSGASSMSGSGTGQGRTKPLTASERELAAVYGILLRDAHNPEQKRRFAQAIPIARGEYNSDKAFYTQVLPELIEAGDERGTVNNRKVDDVRATDLARVVKTLIQQGTKADDIYLRVKVQSALEGVAAGDGRQAASTIEIILPDLEDEVNVDIIVDNLHAMQAIYFSAMLEELKLFQVADKLVDLFNQGVLPLGKGRSGDLLFDYWRKSNDRFTEVERLNLYARSFGFPGGEPVQTPNRDFNDLWLRFVAAVSSFARQLSLDNLLRAQIAASVSQEHVRKSGRDLAANLSLYGYGVAYFAATSLQEQIRDILELLASDEIKSAYGARDAFQVIDQVAQLELGGARSTVRYRTMATSGATIIRWLAKKRTELSSIGIPVIDAAAVKRGGKNPRPIVDPSDRDVVDAAEQWLAVTGTPDAQVEQYAQPVESTNMTSAPNWLSGTVHDALASAGVNAGLPV